MAEKPVPDWPDVMSQSGRKTWPCWPDPLAICNRSALTPKLLETPQSTATYITMTKIKRRETAELMRLPENDRKESSSMNRISEIFLSTVSDSSAR